MYEKWYLMMIYNDNSNDYEGDHDDNNNSHAFLSNMIKVG